MEPWRYKTTGATLDVRRAFEVAFDDTSIQRMSKSGLVSFKSECGDMVHCSQLLTTR
jgi:hypothetical protein